MNDDNESNLAWCITFALFLVSLAMLMSMLFPSSASAEEKPQVSLCWDAPTQRVDGTPLLPGELSKYEIEVEYASGGTIHEAPGDSTQYDMALASFGNNCFRIRVFDGNGLSSEWTEQVCINVLAPPMMIQFRQCGEDG